MLFIARRKNIGHEVGYVCIEQFDSNIGQVLLVAETFPFKLEERTVTSFVDIDIIFYFQGGFS